LNQPRTAATPRAVCEAAAPSVPFDRFYRYLELSDFPRMFTAEHPRAVSKLSILTKIATAFRLR